MSVMSELLTTVPLFAGLDSAGLRELLSHLRERSYVQGQVIALEGEPCTAVYCIGQGMVRLRYLSLDGREHVLAYLGPGECFNLVPALDGGGNIATADALAEVSVYALPCDRFRALLDRHPEMSRPIAEHLAREVRRLSEMIKDLALHTVRTRLARFLLAHAENQPSDRRWTQQEVAAHIGTVRDVVGRVLRSFAEEGYIRRQQGQLVVVDREGLERVASGDD